MGQTGQDRDVHEQLAKVAQAPPADAQLQQRLEQDLQGAEEAMERHSFELERARRVATACRAGLEQLHAPQSEPPMQGRSVY
jgi:hypothetical protein